MSGPLIIETNGNVTSFSVNGQAGTGIATGGSTSGCPVYPGFTGTLGTAPAQLSLTWSSSGSPPSLGIYSETVQEPGQNGCGVPQLSSTPVGFLPGYNLVTSTQTDNAGTGVANAVTAYAYANPANGLRTAQVVDPTGQDLVTSYAYEGAAGFYDLASTTLPAGNSTTDSYYNGTDAPTTATDPCPGGATGIDQGDGLYQQTTPGRTETYVYSSAGQVLASREAASDGWTCSTYDARGRVVAVAYPAFGAAPAYTDSYDYEVGGDPLVTSVTKAVSGGATTTLTTTVNFLGQVISYTDANGGTTTTTYDQAGRVLSTCTVPAGGSTCAAALSTSYDNYGRVAADDVNGALADTPAYDANSDLVGGTYANGTTLAYGYDTEGRLYSEAFDQAGGATLLSDSESLSQAGDVLTDAQAGPAGPLGSATYAYDSAGRLSSADGFGEDLSYAYSPVGGCGALSGAGANSDRTAMTSTNTATGLVTASSYCYGTDDQLSSYQSQAETGSWPLTGVSSSYDADGNTTEMTTGTAASSSPLTSSVTLTSSQNWTVPAIAGATVGVNATGGGGGPSGSTSYYYTSQGQPVSGSYPANQGGAGAGVQASLPVLAGQVLSATVGGEGGTGANGAANNGPAGAGGAGGAGYAAGGTGGSAGTGVGTGGGGGGGGSTAIANNGTLVMEAGGGGGAVADSAYNYYQGTGGSGQIFGGDASAGVVPGTGGTPNSAGSTASVYSVSQGAEVTETAGNGATTSTDGQGGTQSAGYAGAVAGTGTTGGGVGVTNGYWGSGGGGAEATRAAGAASCWR